MALSRVAALRSCFRAAKSMNVRPQLCRHAIRRGYASAGGHGSTKAGGDAIWAAGAIAVTLPTCWYLLANGPEAPHGHSDHHDSHGESHGESHDTEGESEEKEDDGNEDEEKIDGGDEKANDEKSEQSDGSDSGDEGEDADTPDTSDDEGQGDEKKGTEDGATKISGEHKHIPDAKGGSKKRVESDQSKKQGEEAKASTDGSGSKDVPATSKTPGSQNTQSGKQEGISSTDTKHSTPVTEKSDISKKGEGTPETAKAKGTVDPKRPQA